MILKILLRNSQKKLILIMVASIIKSLILISLNLKNYLILILLKNMMTSSKINKKNLPLPILISEIVDKVIKVHNLIIKYSVH